jgi:hypothetical protein
MVWGSPLSSFEANVVRCGSDGGGWGRAAFFDELLGSV